MQNVLCSGLLYKNIQIKIYRTVMLCVVLYGCETWSLTLREERGFRVFDNRVLRRIFWPERDNVAGEWRKLRNVWLNGLYCSPNIVRVIKWRRIRWVVHVARTGERRGVYRVLVGRSNGHHLGDRGIDERIILKWIFRKWDVGALTGLIWLRIGTGGGHL